MRPSLRLSTLNEYAAWLKYWHWNRDWENPRIPMVDPSNFKLPLHKIPHFMCEEVCKHLQEMMALDAIRVSQSPYDSPVFLIYRPNGKSGIDFCKLNSHIFEVAKKENTAFAVGPLRFYRCDCMPFDLCNALATYHQCLMENCFGDIRMQCCLNYPETIAVFSRTFEQHIQLLSMVLEWLTEAGLKLSLRKLFEDKTQYFHQIVFVDGILLTPKRSEVFRNGACSAAKFLRLCGILLQIHQELFQG